MRVCLSVILAGALVAIAGQQAVWAQASFGSRSSGGSVTSGRSSASFGSRSGLGSSGGFGTSTAGQVQGNERFVRGSRQPGEFVGSAGNAAAGSGGFVGSQMAGASPGGSQSIRGLSSLGNRGGGNQSNRSSRRSRDEVRASVRLGFSVVRPPAAIDVVPRLRLQMEKIIQPRANSPIRVEVEKGTATLRGAVASAHDRAIAERLVLLEGGIWKVKNELTVLEAESPLLPE